MSAFMLPTFADAEDVARHLGERIAEWDKAEIAQCESFLDLVSAQIRHHGAAWEDPILAPPIAWAICVAAASRGMQNPAGFSVERGDMVTLTRADPFALGSMLDQTETAMLRSYSGRGGFHSILLVRDVTISDTTAAGGADA